MPSVIYVRIKISALNVLNMYVGFHLLESTLSFIYIYFYMNKSGVFSSVVELDPELFPWSGLLFWIQIQQKWKNRQIKMLLISLRPTFTVPVYRIPCDWRLKHYRYFCNESLILCWDWLKEWRWIILIWVNAMCASSGPVRAAGGWAGGPAAAGARDPRPLPITCPASCAHPPPPCSGQCARG